jgi:uncharacterized iron-regulated membrane protein
MARSKHFYIRKSHRYLGVILGIQFLFWTLGGLYFSWSNLEEIHGDFQHKHVPLLSGNIRLVSPDTILKKLPRVDSVRSLQLISILNQPYYSIAYQVGNESRNALANATTGIIRNAITREEAVKIAAANFNGQPSVQKVEYLVSTGGHHEYRSKPLPAWAVTFQHQTNTTVYVSADYGKVESFRNNKWRLFDFLWMMHTMDYKGRDNINNWLLRAFSIFGLLTIFSGFSLFWISRKKRYQEKILPKAKALTHNKK